MVRNQLKLMGKRVKEFPRKQNVNSRETQKGCMNILPGVNSATQEVAPSGPSPLHPQHSREPFPKFDLPNPFPTPLFPCPRSPERIPIPLFSGGETHFKAGAGPIITN